MCRETCKVQHLLNNHVKRLFLALFAFAVCAGLGLTTWLMMANGGTLSQSQLKKSRRQMAKTCERLKIELPPLDKAAPGQTSPALQKYLAYYDLELENTDHVCGMLKTKNYEIFVHQLIPRKPLQGTIVFSHGYLDHSALYSNFVRFFTDLNYAVVLWDLPGHGLSSGPRAAINDFAHYGTLLADVFETSRKRLPQPYFLIGHSTGCSATMEYMRIHPNEAKSTEAAIFVAPLVRSYAWHSSQFARRLIEPVVSTLPHINRQVTHNDDFQFFLEKADPLRCDAIPLPWVHALTEWNRDIHNWSPPAQRPALYIIQGTDDTVVSWQYNLEFLTQIFPDAKVKKIPGGYHHLLNEKPSMRAQVYAYILKALSDM